MPGQKLLRVHPPPSLQLQFHDPQRILATADHDSIDVSLNNFTRVAGAVNDICSPNFK